MPNPNAASPTEPQVLTLFQEELARAATMPGLAADGPALWPRFAGYYQGLTRLPRRLRRALQRRWRRSLGGIALLCALGQAPVFAATINVGGGCTLVDAITAANSDAPAGGCAAGSGADTIVPPFPFGFSPLTTVNNDTDGPNGLPVITTAITIEGQGRTITRDSSAPPFRIIAVGATGNLTLEDTTVSGGVAPFQSGGGIFNGGTLTLSRSTVSGNTAALSGGGIKSGDINSVATLTVTNSTVSGNTADSGGGIGNVEGTLTLTNSTISGNTAAYSGGGISSVGIYSGGNLTLTNITVSGNTAHFGGGIRNNGTLTLTNSTVEGNSAGSSDGGGIFNDGTMTLGASTVSGNTATRDGGGIDNFGTLTLTSGTVSGNMAGSSGGGIDNSGTMTLTNSTVEGNTAQSRGGGINNPPGFDYQGTHYANVVALTNSTVSGNTAGTIAGGVSNGDQLTLTNSTVSGNIAADRGGAVENSGTVTLTNTTVSRNASGRVAGGLFNTGTVTLVQSLLSGNTAPVIGPEAYSVSGNVIGDSFNVFGHDGFSGVAGFTLGATDLVPAVPLSAILAPTLGYNGGPTKTHTLVFGSPAVDTIPGAACATGTDSAGRTPAPGRRRGYLCRLRQRLRGARTDPHPGGNHQHYARLQ